MEKFGKRMLVDKSSGDLKIEIPAYSDGNKNTLLLLWLLAFTACGLIVILELFKPQEENTKIYLVVFVAFWLYFELKILRAYRWRKSGKEIISIKGDKFLLIRETAGRGFQESYLLNDMSNLRKLERVDKEKGFADVMNNSYWVVSGETLAFHYNSKEVRFGLQLDESEASALFKHVKQYLT